MPEKENANTEGPNGSEEQEDQAIREAGSLRADRKKRKARDPSADHYRRD